MTTRLAIRNEDNRAVSTCQHPSDNHSKDRFTIWHGEQEPLILCGFHERQGITNALNQIRKEQN